MNWIYLLFIINSCTIVCLIPNSSYPIFLGNTNVTCSIKLKTLIIWCLKKKKNIDAQGWNWRARWPETHVFFFGLITSSWLVHGYVHVTLTLVWFYTFNVRHLTCVHIWKPLTCKSSMLHVIFTPQASQRWLGPNKIKLNIWCFYHIYSRQGIYASVGSYARGLRLTNHDQ